MILLPKKALARAVVLGLLLLGAACTGQPPAANSQPGTPTVVLMTQVVTQIVAPTPIPMTPTTPPTATIVPVTPTPTYDPLSAPIYYPLSDCVASRLHIGDRAMVSLDGGPNGIRYGRDMAEDTVFAYAQPGQILEIVNGPYCSRGWIVWQVRTGDGQVGFTPEGDGNNYWLFPAAP
jgi:hypothetical protein